VQHEVVVEEDAVVPGALPEKETWASASVRVRFVRRTKARLHGTRASTGSEYPRPTRTRPQRKCPQL
jgi:hypothetical protein